MIIALSGPSGVGKGYAKEAILKENPEVREAVWYTTRKLRPGEKNRKSVPNIEFSALEHAGKLVLVQEMFGHHYAMRKEDLIATKDVILTEIHPYVVQEAKKINPNIILIGMATDDIELLRERLSIRRKTESPEEIERRLQTAMAEIAAIRESYKLFNTVIRVERTNESEIASMAQKIFKVFIEKEAK